MALRRLSAVACILGLQIYLGLAHEAKDCPANICPAIADETSFYQRFLQLQLRGQESLKSRGEDIAGSESSADNTEFKVSADEEEFKVSAEEKWQEFKVSADEEETENSEYAVRLSSVGLVAARMEDKLGTGMGTGYWVLLLLLCCCCCCGPAIMFGTAAFAISATPKRKPLNEFQNTAAKSCRQKFDQECPEKEQEQYNWYGEKGSKLIQKASDIIDNEDKKNTGKAVLKDLHESIADAFPGVDVGACNHPSSIDKLELFEMFKYFQYKKDEADGVLGKKDHESASSASSASSDSGDEKKKKKAGAKAVAAGKGKAKAKGKKKEGKESSSSDDGGVADIATGIAAGVVMDEAIDAAMSDDSD